MPLEAVPKMMRDAMAKAYAIGYFESWSIDSLQGAIDAAEQTYSPIIVGFSGEFLCRPGRVTKEKISWYGALGRAAAESATVPCGLIFNECPHDESVREAVRAGFNLVMPADPSASYETYTKRVKNLTKFAHGYGVAVEAEQGKLPNGVSGQIDDGGFLTDIETAVQFAKETGIDMLAVSVGNVHAMVEGQNSLNLDHLEALRQKVSIPLVLHGGSGIPEDSLRQAISLGVAKVNYGTYVKQRYLSAIRNALRCNDTNPHNLLGYGGEKDLLVIGRRAVCEAILERLTLLGCCGHA